jgi:hypothetical protein
VDEFHRILDVVTEFDSLNGLASEVLPGAWNVPLKLSGTRERERKEAKGGVCSVRSCVRVGGQELRWGLGGERACLALAQPFPAALFFACASRSLPEQAHEHDPPSCRPRHCQRHGRSVHPVQVNGPVLALPPACSLFSSPPLPYPSRRHCCEPPRGSEMGSTHLGRTVRRADLARQLM